MITLTIYFVFLTLYQSTPLDNTSLGISIIDGNVSDKMSNQFPSDLDKVCGISPNTRIVGGTDAHPKSWPWMAGLINKTGKRTFCGASLISEWYLITAAHCLIGQNHLDILIRLGAYDFSADGNSDDAKDYEMENFRIHERYNSRSQENDIAMIKLKEKVQIPDSFRPICLPDGGKTFFNRKAIVIGWGSLEYGGLLGTKLQQVSVPIWNDTACRASYAKNNLNFTDKVYCAGYPEGGRDACQGDSGGPLMIQGAEGRWQLIGIVSFGFRCAEPNYPGVYTRITSYLDWIDREKSESIHNGSIEREVD
ncbi:proclotting enzyme-like [Brevipalpus obovatus]|uniref:proclotting enzyme-like n=1 Tax=Brevipalpus obovatus TaxID=246614 RepID=UPI003D9F51E1